MKVRKIIWIALSQAGQMSMHFRHWNFRLPPHSV